MSLFIIFYNFQWRFLSYKIFLIPLVLSIAIVGLALPLAMLAIAGSTAWLCQWLISLDKPMARLYIFSCLAIVKVQSKGIVEDNRPKDKSLI